MPSSFWHEHVTVNRQGVHCVSTIIICTLWQQHRIVGPVPIIQWESLSELVQDLSKESITYSHYSQCCYCELVFKCRVLRLLSAVTHFHVIFDFSPLSFSAVFVYSFCAEFFGWCLVPQKKTWNEGFIGQMPLLVPTEHCQSVEENLEHLVQLKENHPLASSWLDPPNPGRRVVAPLQ